MLVHLRFKKLSNEIPKCINELKSLNVRNSGELASSQHWMDVVSINII